MHALLPTIAIIAVTILASLGKITGDTAVFVILAAAGIGSTGAASVTGAAVSGQSSTDAIKVSKENPPTQGES